MAGATKKRALLLDGSNALSSAWPDTQDRRIALELEASGELNNSLSATRGKR
jgi:hypothetical protein